MVCEQFANGELRYSKLKPMLTNIVISTLKPIQIKRKELEENRDYVAQVLSQGAEQASKIAVKTMSEVKQLIGLS